MNEDKTENKDKKEGTKIETILQAVLITAAVGYGIFWAVVGIFDKTNQHWVKNTGNVILAVLVVTGMLFGLASALGYTKRKKN